MKKTKNETDIAPRRLQQLFIGTAVTAYLLNMICWLLLLEQAYGRRGFRLSQFSVIAISEIVLPVILFVCAFFLVKASSSRTGHLFMASVLALTGVVIGRFVTLIDIAVPRQLAHSGYRSEPIWALVTHIIIPLVIYAGVLLFIRSYKNRFPAARAVLLAYVVVAALYYIAFVIANLIMPEFGDTPKMTGFPFSLMQLTQITLPLVFVGVAYFGIPKVLPRRERVGLVLVSASIGTLVFQAVLSLDMIVRQFPGAEDIMWPDTMLMAGTLSLLVFIGIVFLYRFYDRSKR